MTKRRALTQDKAKANHGQSTQKIESQCIDLQEESLISKDVGTPIEGGGPLSGTDRINTEVASENTPTKMVKVTELADDYETTGRS